jgi:sugar phosphate isomerase/epimerase
MDGMSEITRREFISKATIATGAIALLSEAPRVHATPLGLPIGSQTWPTRSMLKDFPAYLKKMADIGVTRLELCSPIGYGGEFAVLSNAKEVVKVLSDHGMKSESSHFTMGELRKSQQKSLDWAREIGITQIITASLGGSHPTLDEVKRAADEYNKIAAISAEAGMQQGLHNEGFEMSVVESKKTYDLLHELLDPTLVKFQFQMSTIVAGFVAADYFTKYPGRFYSMHLQDVDLGKSTKENEDIEPDPRGVTHPQVAMGKGSIDWKRTFAAAKVGGVKNYFVEQNWELTQQSVEFLKTFKA